ncbi:hypothetical protein HZA75_06540 [Candidatus Roizmanbacteria bacterium]|nr:hypothetical protein [Candidatus Roizmanbacteria bacterium]
MAEIKPRKINLIQTKNEGLFNQFLSWSLTVGRLLVIITETLALSVFLYRFSLDMKIVDIHDKIKTESLIVANFKTGEETYRNIQSKIALAKDYDHTGEKTLNILKDVIDMGRNKITFTSIIVKMDAILITIQGTSAGLLYKFTQDLKNYPAVDSVSVDRVENKPSSSLATVGITVKLKTIQQ